MTSDPYEVALAEFEATTNGHAPDPLADVETGHHIPEWIWATSARLGHIRDAARARRVSPDAVLATTLARVAAFTTPDIRLPAIVGDDANAGLLINLFGPPSSGKSSAVAVARRLVPRPDHVLARLDGFPLGSGEGLAEAFYGEVVGDDGKTKERVIVARNAFVYADEGQIVSALASRQGSTLMTTLRTVFTAGTLGQGNASADRRRIVPANSYALSVVLATQEARAGDLLADVDAGTPQRFLCVLATDPNAPELRPLWPGPLGWVPPTLAACATRMVVDGVLVGYYEVDPTIWEAIDIERLADIRGRDADPWLAHRDLKRLKVAANLALLHSSVDVSIDRWAQAGSIVACSDRVLGRARGVIAGIVTATNASTDKRKAEQAVRSTVEIEAHHKRAAARWIARQVHRMTEVRRSELRRGSSLLVRSWWAEGVEIAVGHDWIRVEQRPSASSNGTTSTWLVVGEKRP